MKNKNLKGAIAFALVSAVFAVGNLFAAPKKNPPKPEEIFLEKFGEAKVIRGGIVTNLSLDAESEEVTMLVSFGQDSLEIKSDDEIKFIGKCAPAPRPQNEMNAAPRGENFHSPRHEAAPEKRTPDREEISDPLSFKLGDKVFVIFASDGNKVEKVIRLR